MSESSAARRIAEHLLRIEAVSFAPEDPFTWASGLRAPVYCDNRVTISYPTVRRHIRDAFARTLEERGLSPNVIAGTATAGIPHAAWLAELLDLPMVYVRSTPKEHGRGAQIEGRLEAGRSVAVIEDLVSTGGSSRAVVEALREAGAEVTAVLAIVSYELDAAARTFADLDLPLYTLTCFDALFEVARENGVLSSASIRSILDWRADPERWSELHRRAAR